MLYRRWQTYIQLNETHNFQQDGAPAHYEVNDRQYLHTIFPNRWIGRRGSVELPARITIFSYHVKSMVYKTKLDDLAGLRRRITLAIRSITPQMLTNVARDTPIQ
ncbi:hypothetical protein NQ318_006706 [Aromia moschata]|uniref:Uncharacterized protein n=1 Tax=Aromia moschata TaxID=1265417 RepID=A0AAV8YQD0_9CUCU|nr:hypothetical protein NQ318_006706 [Aromia moschata]